MLSLQESLVHGGNAAGGHDRVSLLRLPVVSNGKKGKRERKQRIMSMRKNYMIFQLPRICCILVLSTTNAAQQWYKIAWENNSHRYVHVILLSPTHLDIKLF